MIHFVRNVVLLLLFFGTALLLRPGIARADCCLGPTPAYYLYDTEKCLYDISPPGTWSLNHHPDTEAGKCVLNPSADAPIATIETSAEPAQPKPALIYIPNVDIPGLFEGKIEVGSETIGQYIAAFYMFFVSITGIFAITMLLYGGYRRITAAGNASKIQESNDITNGALAGVVLTMVSYLLLNLINPTLTKLSGFQLPEVKPILFKLEQSEVSLKGAPQSDIVIDESGTIQNIPKVDVYDDLLKVAADNAGIQRSLLKAIMLVESHGRPHVISPAGACGLMQVMPANVGQSNCSGMIADAITTTDSDAAKAQKTAIFQRNIREGARVLANAIKKTCPDGQVTSRNKTYTCTPKETQCRDGDLRFAIAAYNGGIVGNCSSNSCPGETFWQCKENQGYAETRNYVQKVIATQNTILQRGWEPK